LLSAIFFAYRFRIDKGLFSVRSGLSEYVIGVFVSLLFFVFLFKVIAGRKTKETPLVCNFPLKNGNYYIAHGGASKIINHHHHHHHHYYLVGAQRYALDIMKLNKFGFRCKGVYPSKSDR